MFLLEDIEKKRNLPVLTFCVTHSVKRSQINSSLTRNPLDVMQMFDWWFYVAQKVSKLKLPPPGSRAKSSKLNINPRFPWQRELSTLRGNSFTLMDFHFVLGLNVIFKVKQFASLMQLMLHLFFDSLIHLFIYSIHTGSMSASDCTMVKTHDCR